MTKSILCKNLRRLRKCSERSGSSLPEKILLFFTTFTARSVVRHAWTWRANAKKAVETYFLHSMERGPLRWKVVNIDLPENYHYLEDYIIMYNTLVIQQYIDGKPGEWKELWHAWIFQKRKTSTLNM